MAQKKNPLGRNLSSMLSKSTLQHAVEKTRDESSGSDSLRELPLDVISPGPYQPRSIFDTDRLEDLAESIRHQGVIQPVVVRESGDKQYELIAGERRLRAAQMAGLKTVPAVLREADSQDHLLLALIENVQRADLNPLETASAYQSLAVEFGLSHQEIGKRVGKSRTAVTNTMRLLDLPDVVQQAIRKNQISMGHARALLALPTIKAQSAALQTILTQGFNVRQTEDLVNQLKGKKKIKTPKKNPKSPELKALEEDLQSALGTRVRLTRSNKGVGTITVHYYSDEEFNSLMDHFLKK